MEPPSLRPRRWQLIALLCLLISLIFCTAEQPQVPSSEDKTGDIGFVRRLSSQKHHHRVFPLASVIPPSPDDDVALETCGKPHGVTCEAGFHCVAHPTFKNNDESAFFCLHKTLLPVSLTDVATFLLAFCACSLAAMAGIGGGGLLFPILLAMEQFTPKQASVVGNAGVLGNALAQVVYNYWSMQKSLDASQQATVLSTVMMILPSVVAGGSIAIAFQGLVPSTAILVLALFTLTLATVKMYAKASGRRRAAKANSKQKEAKESKEVVDVGIALGEAQQETTALTRRIVSSLVFLIVICWCVNVLLSIVIKTWVQKCTVAYFVSIMGAPTLSAIVFLLTAKKELLSSKSPKMCKQQISGEESSNLRKATDKEAAELEEQKSSLLSSPSKDGEQAGSSSEGCDKAPSKTTNDVATGWALPLASFVVGILSAILGIGGGELIGPLLLILFQMPPSTSSAATAILSFCNSAANQVHHITENRVTSIGYSLTVAMVGCCGGVVGRTVVRLRAGRGSDGGSFIAWSLLAVLCVATGLVLWELLTSPPSWNSSGVC